MPHTKHRMTAISCGAEFQRMFSSRCALPRLRRLNVNVSVPCLSRPARPSDAARECRDGTQGRGLLLRMRQRWSVRPTSAAHYSRLGASGFSANTSLLACNACLANSKWVSAVLAITMPRRSGARKARVTSATMAVSGAVAATVARSASVTSQTACRTPS